MEKLAKQLLDLPSEKNAYILLNALRTQKYYNTAVSIGKFFVNLYPESINLRSETSLSAILSQKNFRLAYELYASMNCLDLSEIEKKSFEHNKYVAASFIVDDYINYNKNIVDNIMSKPKNPIPLITFTITTCKRFDLFEKTINSFLNCCTDLHRIDKWLCVDDNSSEEDRIKMKEKYPFFTFYFKTKDEKGHPRSMNIIRNTVTTPFIFHMEDDWKFFHKTSYIEQCMDALLVNEKIGQCLVNRNYAETLSDRIIVGGMLVKTKNGKRFYVHEYTSDNKSYMEFQKKYGVGKLNCAYWPHFSFRPSMFKREILQVIGPYNEDISHFEKDYSLKYANRGYMSMFLDGIHCLHIGRLTTQRFDKSVPNAYDLNNEVQFEGEVQCTGEEKMRKKRFSINGVKTYVINLENREDRLKKFDQNSPIEYTRFSAIDGKKLKPNEQLQKIFEGNDYNMRVGLVGIAMSHIKLLIELINSEQEIFCIFEDDVTFGDKFEEQIKHVLSHAPPDWDLIYLGHHLYPQYKPNSFADEMPLLHQLSVHESLQKSMGGMYGYLVTKKGAEKFLNFINQNGMTNGIDTVQQKAIDKMNTYYCSPHIVFSECALPGKKIDSDIQYNYDSVSMSNYIDNNKYPDRLKKNGVYNIDDAIQYESPRKFQFTNNWFNRNINISMKILQKIFENTPVRILEIGTHEGQSAIWMLENLCQKPGSTFTSIDPYSTSDTTAPVTDETYKRFIYNIELCTQKSKFNQYVGYSQKIMPKLIEEKKVYDVVYIDGSHLMDDVLVDMNNAHQLLETNGIMLMDDAGFDHNRDDDVMGAIKKFLSSHPEQYRIVLKEWQWMIQKL